MVVLYLGAVSSHAAVLGRIPVGSVPRLAMTVTAVPALTVLPTLELTALPQLSLPPVAVLAASPAIPPAAPGIVHAEPERRPSRARRSKPALANLEAVAEISEELQDQPKAVAASNLNFAFDEARRLRF